MTDKNLTHIYLLLDRSGSMQSIKTDTEGGFAAFVEEQKRTPGECRVTLAQFDNHYDVVYADRPIADVPALDLQPRGSTALLDAMGKLDHRRRRQAGRAGGGPAARHRDRRDHDRRLRERQPGVDPPRDQGAGGAADRAATAGSSSTWAPTRTRSRSAATSASRPTHAVTYGRGKSQDVMASASAKIAEYRTAKAGGRPGRPDAGVHRRGAARTVVGEGSPVDR